MCKPHANVSRWTIPQWAVLGVLLTTPLVCALAAAPDSRIDFKISPGPLHHALNVFAEQSGLQTAYDPKLLNDKRAPAVSGRMPIAAALDQLLGSSGLDWSLASESVITVRARPSAAEPPATPLRRAIVNDARGEQVVSLPDVSVQQAAPQALPEVNSAVLGFNKPILETPRAVSFISEQTMDRFALGAVENLLRVVPGVYTTTRFGIQGAVDIRAVPADFLQVIAFAHWRRRPTYWSTRE